MPRTFRAVFYIRCALRTAPQELQRHNFQFGSTMVSLYALDPEEAAARQLTGFVWILDVSTTAESLQGAQEKAHTLANEVLASTVLTVGVPLRSPAPIVVYETTPDIEATPFRQFLSSFPMSTAPLVVMVPEMADVAKTMRNQDTPNLGRIQRAARWLRRALLSDNRIDQFVLLWLGLESLNSALAGHYGVDKVKYVEVGVNCPSCEAPISKTVPVQAGVDKLLEDQGFDEEARRRLKNTRNGIVHGYAGYSDDLLACVREDGGRLAVALFTGLRVVLGQSASKPAAKEVLAHSDQRVGLMAVLDCQLIRVTRGMDSTSGTWPMFEVNTVVNTKDRVKAPGHTMNAVLKLLAGAQQWEKPNLTLAGWPRMVMGGVTGKGKDT